MLPLRSTLGGRVGVGGGGIPVFIPGIEEGLGGAPAWGGADVPGMKEGLAEAPPGVADATTDATTGLGLGGGGTSYTSTRTVRAGDSMYNMPCVTATGVVVGS